MDQEHIVRTSALASECIIPTLVRLRNEQQKLLALNIADKRSKHYRWLYYIFLSLVVGGKIATSTMKLFAMGARSRTEIRRTVNMCKDVAQVARAAGQSAMRALEGLRRQVSGVFTMARSAARKWCAQAHERHKTRQLRVRPRRAKPAPRRSR